MELKKVMVVSWLSLLGVGVGGLFWYNEWVYTLPTPVPVNYQSVGLGKYISFTSQLHKPSGKPVLLHFYNPKCPCSRFNLPHFKSLIKAYGKDVDFVIVPIIPDGKQYTARQIQDQTGLDIAVLVDPGIAKSCGVYSTPQAVIITANSKLYYRGNYNKSRYCTDKKSNYAQMALDSLLSQNVNPVFSQSALEAYGCKITMCSSK
jgi:hypothetical protein